jgi:hypothetical protein
LRLNETGFGEAQEGMSELRSGEQDPLYKQVQDWKTKLGAIVNSSDSGSSYPSQTAVPDQASAAPPSQ